MPAPTKSSEAVSPRKRRSADAGKPAATPRRRTVRKAAPPVAAHADESTTGASASPGGDRGRQAEQLGLVALAIVLGLIGFAVHFLWFASIVVMSVLFGLIASELRGRRTGGVTTAVVDAFVGEARNVVDAATGADESAEGR